MTNIVFYKKNNLIIGFEVKGHTGKDDFGKDLLCCQISTVAQLAVVGLNDIEGLKFFKEISDGYLKVSLDYKLADNKQVQYLFKVCLDSFRSIIIDEKKYAKLEVKNV